MDFTFTLLLLVTSLMTFTAAMWGAERIGPVWSALTARRMGQLGPRAEAVGFDRSRIESWLVWWGVALIVIPVAFWYLLDLPLVGLAVAYFVFILPRHLLDYQIQRRKRLLRDQLVPATQGLANAARAGLTLHQGLAEIAGETERPLQAVLKRIVADYERGRPLKDALEQTRQRLQLEPFTLFAAALQVSLERGGRVTEALSRIATSLRDNQRVERKMEADTASGRRAVLILSLFPLLFLGLFYMLDPQSISLLFTGVPGQVVLVAVAALVYVGGRMAFRLMEIKA